MESTKFFIDPMEYNFLEVEYETSHDWSAGAGDELVIDLCGVSLNGEMSLKLESLPANWRRDIHEQIRKEVWEQVQQAA